MFSCPPGQEMIEGITDDRPICLPGVTRVEFRALLDFFYNGYVGEISIFHKNPNRRHLKIIFLQHARRPQIIVGYMDRIRQRAIRQIISHRVGIDPIEKIVLAEQHDIADWLPSAYASLCQRVNPLEEWEAEKLGLRTTVKLARAREAVRELEPLDRCPVPRDSDDAVEDRIYDPYKVSRIVDEVFFPSSNRIVHPPPPPLRGLPRFSFH